MAKNATTQQTKIKTVLSELVADIRTRFISYVATVVITLFSAGLFWIWRTGGTFYSLPLQVTALEEANAQYDELLREQKEINLQQRELNLLQKEYNLQNAESLRRIEQQVVSIENYLRQKQE